MAKIGTLIFLIGEQSLVKEFGEVCHRAGFEIKCMFNEKLKATTLPHYLKRVTAIPRNASIGFELTNTDIATKKKNLQLLDKNLPSSHIILSSSITVTALEQSTWIQHPKRLSGISAMPTLLNQKLIELAPTVHTSKQIISQTQTFFQQLTKEVVVIQDRIGMVMPRILCMLVNEASFALMEGIAAPADIDTAMKLGTNYPSGPVQWGNAIGFQQIVSILDALYDDLGEERYRVAPLLRQLATGPTWWAS